MWFVVSYKLKSNYYRNHVFFCNKFDSKCEKYRLEYRANDTSRKSKLRENFQFISFYNKISDGYSVYFSACFYPLRSLLENPFMGENINSFSFLFCNFKNKNSEGIKFQTSSEQWNNRWNCGHCMRLWFEVCHRTWLAVYVVDVL